MRPDFSGSLCNVRRSLGCGMGFFVVICTAARCLAQAPPLPAYLTLPAQVQMKPGSVQEDYGEALFAINGKPDAIEQIGRAHV